MTEKLLFGLLGQIRPDASDFVEDVPAPAQLILF